MQCYWRPCYHSLESDKKLGLDPIFFLYLMQLFMKFRSRCSVQAWLSLNKKKKERNLRCARLEWWLPKSTTWKLLQHGSFFCFHSVCCFLLSGTASSHKSMQPSLNTKCIQSHFFYTYCSFLKKGI